MIDWVTAKLPCDNSISAGCFAKLDAKGNVEWLTYSPVNPVGSHDITIRVKSLTQIGRASCRERV